MQATGSYLKHIFVCFTPRRHKTYAWAVPYNHVQDWSPETAPAASTSGGILLSASVQARSGSWRLRLQFPQQTKLISGLTVVERVKGSCWPSPLTIFTYISELNQVTDGPNKQQRWQKKGDRMRARSKSRRHTLPLNKSVLTKILSEKTS